MKPIRNFVSPHVHQHSLDSASRPEEFIEREKELQTGHTVVTDHGSLAACRKVYDLAKDPKAGLTPILGLEAYFRDESCPYLIEAGVKKTYFDPIIDPENAALYPEGTFKDHLKYMHLTMHFMDQPAYECAVRLLSKADDRAERHGSERKPLFDWNQLEELGSHNITFGSSCLIGMVSRHLLVHEDLDTAIKYYERIRSIVKPGNFIVEVFPHKCDKNWVKGTFLTLEDGQIFKFHDKKWLMTNEGEIRAEDLVNLWNKKDDKYTHLLGIKNRSKWQDITPAKIAKIEHIEDFLPDDPCDWAPDGDVQAGLNRAMIEIANKYGDPILISDDSHYSNQEQSIIQDVKLAQSGNWRFHEKYHRQSSEEALGKLKNSLDITEKEFERWVDNSYEWASKFKGFEFKTEPSLPVKFYEVNYPKYEWFTEIDKNDHSLMYTMELIRKHGRMDWGNEVYSERLQKEIELLHNNGIIDLLPYFFVIEEVCELYEKNGLLTGPGRGSAGGVLLAYLLGCTHVDPIENELSFERFITLDRIKSGKLPDIDTDFGNRELLTDPENGFLKRRFGAHYAQISVDSTLKARMAIKDVSRFTRGFVPTDIEILTKKLIKPPQGVDDYDFLMGYETDAGFVQGSINYDPALKEYISKYPDDWEIVLKAVRQTRSKGRHASAFIIANRPISDFIPMTTVSDVKVTAYTANSVEAVGGLKYDFLVVNSLSDLSDAIQLIQSQVQLNPRELGYEIIEHDEDLVGWSGPRFTEKRFSVIIDGKRVPCNRLIPYKGKFYDVWALPYDKGVFADIKHGKTETVFQLCTPSAVQWLRKFEDERPDGTFSINSIADMAIFTALDRPGPLEYYIPDPENPKHKHNMLVEYANRIQGKTPSDGINPVFDELLPETEGIMLYQESLQKVYQNLTGCSLAEAEEFRSDVAKKKKAKIEKAYSKFIRDAGNKIGEKAAKEVWKAFITWSEYGFCKAHSTSYVTTSYATAFLKHNYNLQWWCSVLKNADKNEINDKFWRYCGSIIDNPDLKLSGKYFEIQNGRIRAPLSLLHGVGEGAHNQLLKYAPYTDINDFCNKIERHKIETGQPIKKIAKKTRTIKDPITKEKRKEIIEIEVDGFKKGHSAINRSTVYTLIIAGAMDGLFPETKEDGTKFTFIDQMEEFEKALALSTGAKKVMQPDSEYINLNQLQRFQLKKKILPAYSEDLSALFYRFKISDVYKIKDNESAIYFKYKNKPLRFIGPDDIDNIENFGIPDGEPIRAAVACYVEDSRNFTYQGNREACSLLLDVNGGRFEYVKWPDRDSNKISDVFKKPLKGALCIAILYKYKDEKPFTLDDLIIIEEPRNEK